MKFVSLALLLALRISAATPWELLSQGATEENPTKRAQAIAALGTVRTAQAEKLIEAALSDRDSFVRLTAVVTLADRRSR